MKMKKCPKCKAEIEQEARFCLYCMTSFEEKQTIQTPKENDKRWLSIIAAVFAFVLIALGVFFFAQNNSPTDKENNVSSGPSTDSDFDVLSTDTTTSEQQNSKPTGSETFIPAGSNPTQTTSKSKENTTGKTSAGATTKNSASSTSTSANHTSTGGSSQNNTTSNNTTSNSTTVSNTYTTASSSHSETKNSSSNTVSPTTTSSVTQTVTYIYRDARYGDDFSVSANFENAVVITGVKTAAANGEYTIPETINGKKVIAIMALAFCDSNISSTVKTVVVPSSVRTIWDNAFANCYNLTDIYFKGNAIYTETNAFAQTSKRNATLTIHCSANCSDRNYRYYKNSASYYDAEYQEWNG